MCACQESQHSHNIYLTIKGRNKEAELLNDLAYIVITDTHQGTSMENVSHEYHHICDWL